jgi:indolepyruvate ferredoxin oxidoreductase, beta subunit
MAKNTNILLVGVGGQGTLLAADVVALVGMEIGLDVKKSEVHGMAQRGGSVTSHVRWGEQVHSPLIPIGEVDYFIAFERLEALRYVDTLRPEAVALVNDYTISPVAVSSGDGVYPSQEDQDAIYGPLVERVHYVPAIDLAQELGNPRVNNVVMLGALSSLLDVPEEVWLEVISERVPERYIALNRRAFAVGREHMHVALAR